MAHWIIRENFWGSEVGRSVAGNVILLIVEPYLCSFKTHSSLCQPIKGALVTYTAKLKGVVQEKFKPRCVHRNKKSC